MQQKLYILTTKAGWECRHDGKSTGKVAMTKDEVLERVKMFGQNTDSFKVFELVPVERKFVTSQVEIV